MILIMPESPDLEVGEESLQKRKSDCLDVNKDFIGLLDSIENEERKSLIRKKKQV